MPARRSRINPIPVPLTERCGLAVPSEEPEEHLGRGSIILLRCPHLRGRDLLTVDVKKRLQGEWRGLGLHLVLTFRQGAAGGDFVRLPLGPWPSRGALATCSACARARATRSGSGQSWDRERSLPGSGPIRRRCSFAGVVSCVPSSASSLDDGLHDLRSGSLAHRGSRRQRWRSCSRLAREVPAGDSWRAGPSGVRGLPLTHEASEMVRGVTALPRRVRQREGRSTTSAPSPSTATCASILT